MQSTTCEEERDARCCIGRERDDPRVSFALLITDTHPYHVWVESNFAERMSEAIRGVDKMATRPIFVSLCKDPRFHGIQSGIQEVAVDSADILRSYGIMVTTDCGMWRLMYGHAGNHYMNNQTQSWKSSCLD